MPIIGRETPADIVVPAPQVSARHAEIKHLGGDLYQLTDLGSSNGVFVNGQRIQSATVRLTDRVQLGSFQLDLRAYAHLVPQAPPAVIGPQGQPIQPMVSPAPGVGIQAQRQQAQVPARQPSPAPAQQPAYAQPGLGTELAVALVIYLPGLIMNIMYLSEAKRIKQMTGQSPAGMGCLQVLLIFYVVLPLAFLIILIVTGGAILTSIANSF